LADKLANNYDNDDELKQVIFGHGFGAITNIEVGPDGYLYILSLNQGGPNCDINYPEIPCVKYNSEIKGVLYKIIPQ
jgi:hypothetical protein